MRHPKSKQLFTYWNQLRGHRPAPDRSEIEPNDIRKLLGDVFILQQDQGRQQLVYRLAGTRICNAYGRELKSESYLEHWNGQDNFDILCALSKLSTSYDPCLFSFYGVTAQERFVDFETLILPLQPVQDNQARMIGVTSSLQQPYWLGEEPIIAHKLRIVRHINPKNAPQFAQIFSPGNLGIKHAYAELGLSTKHFAPTPAKAPRAPENFKKFGHLSVYDGGKS